MVVDEVLVDRPAPREAFVDAVPVVDIVLIHAPAQVNFFAAEQRREIDQADVEIFHQNAQSLRCAPCEFFSV